MKTMLRLGAERDTLNVVEDQIGTPTYAGDLAGLIVDIIVKDSSSYGLYHYSNEGVASWYDFAKAIFDLSGAECKLLPIRTEAYPTPAKRPAYSVMDKSKAKETFGIEIPYWRDSLEQCMKTLKSESYFRGWIQGVKKEGKWTIDYALQNLYQLEAAKRCLSRQKIKSHQYSLIAG